MRNLSGVPDVVNGVLPLFDDTVPEDEPSFFSPSLFHNARLALVSDSNSPGIAVVRPGFNPNSGIIPQFMEENSHTMWLNSDSLDEPLLNPAAADGSHTSRELESWDHCHQRSANSNPGTKARNQLIIASVLCLIFMIAEAVGGYISNSVAVMTDAAHMLSDFTSFLVSLFSLWVAQRPPSKKMSFGYYRAEILGALVSVVIIWIITGVLVYLAIDRVIHPNYDIDADTMIIVSGLGVFMNIGMGLVLHGGCCAQLAHGHTHSLSGHSHSHSHSHSHGHAHDEKNLNIRAALIHVFGDLLQSIGVLIAAYVIKYRPDFRLADPICTFVFSGLVLATTAGIIRDATHILMEGVPPSINYHALKEDLKRINQDNSVVDVHSLHIWALSLNRTALAVHLAIDSRADWEKVLKKALRLVQSKYGIHHCTIQVERYDSNSMETCPQCQALND